MHGDLLTINLLLLMNNDLNFPNHGKKWLQNRNNDKETKLIFHFSNESTFLNFCPQAMHV